MREDDLGSFVGEGGINVHLADQQAVLQVDRWPLGQEGAGRLWGVPYDVGWVLAVVRQQGMSTGQLRVSKLLLAELGGGESRQPPRARVAEYGGIGVGSGGSHAGRRGAAVIAAASVAPY